MSQKPVVIFGIGSFAQVAAVYLDRDSSREVVGYTVDGQYVDTDSNEFQPGMRVELTRDGMIRRAP